MENSMLSKSLLSLCGIAVFAVSIWVVVGKASRNENAIELLNVSYDPTRELWKDLNAIFVKQYEKEKGITVGIDQSHGGSGSQARLVIDGLDADVVTLGLWSDTDAIRKMGLISADWEERLPNHSVPYYSTIVFVVHKGNPKLIKDWPDLARADVKIITPNPKTSGNGKLSFLAAWGSVIERGSSESEARDFVGQIYQGVPVLESGARGSATTFAQKHIGDVHLTWENEAYLEVGESGGELEIVYPPLSIQAEPPVAVVDANVDRKRTRPAAEAYLKFLYTQEAQEVIANHHYRPIDSVVAQRRAQEFPEIKLFPLTRFVRDGAEAQEKFFAEGGVFDQIYQYAGK
jgi:sulfate transport system substrate-binding protein